MRIEKNYDNTVTVNGRVFNLSDFKILSAGGNNGNYSSLRDENGNIYQVPVGMEAQIHAWKAYKADPAAGYFASDVGASDAAQSNGAIPAGYTSLINGSSTLFYTNADTNQDGQKNEGLVTLQPAVAGKYLTAGFVVGGKSGYLVLIIKEVAV